MRTDPAPPPGTSGNFAGTDIVPEPPELDQFLLEVYPKPRHIIGPIHSEHIVIAAGGPGTGKTNLAVKLAHAITSGRSFLGWHTPQQSSVLYVDGEMSGRQLQDRFKLYEWPNDRSPLKVVNAISWGASKGMSQPNLSEPEWQDHLCQWANDGDVVLLDNVMSLVNVPGISFASDEFWRTVTPLNLRLRAKGCTVIWFDHTNADGMPFGTRTKQWLADLVFTLNTNEKTANFEETPGVAFTLMFKKVRGAKGPEHRDLDIEMTIDDQGKAIWCQTTRRQAEQDIAAELRAQGMTQRQVAAEMDISLGKVNKLLKDWVGS